MTTLFKQAHALTRATIQQGDDYKATFTLCLRAIIADAKQANSEPMANQFNAVFEAIGYTAPPVAKAKPLIASDTIDTAIKTTIVMMFIMAIMALFIAVFTGSIL